MKHTPTPWKWTGTIKYPDGYHYLQTADKKTVILFTEHEAKNEADMEFIVTACNAHEDLVKACQMALSVFDEVLIPGTFYKNLDKQLIYNALAKAGITV